MLTTFKDAQTSQREHVRRIAQGTDIHRAAAFRASPKGEAEGAPTTGWHRARLRFRLDTSSSVLIVDF